MLGKWRGHAEYQQYLIKAISREFKKNPKAIEYLETAILKMYLLNLDKIYEFFVLLFSAIGRPSNQQPEIFRSFLLMSHFKVAGLEEWISYAKSSPIICAMVGVSDHDFPGESTHRDFISRLWREDDSYHLQKFKRKPKCKHGKKNFRLSIPELSSKWLIKLSPERFSNAFLSDCFRLFLPRSL